jgi:hypothetical protein
MPYKGGLDFGIKRWEGVGRGDRRERDGGRGMGRGMGGTLNGTLIISVVG